MPPRRSRDPSPNRPFPELPPGADALVDRLTISCRLGFPGFRAAALPDLRRRLVAAGIVEAGGATFAKVRFEWTCPLADVRLGLHGRLKLVQTADGGVLRHRGQ